MIKLSICLFYYRTHELWKHRLSFLPKCLLQISTMNAKMYKFDYIKNSVKDYLQKIFLEKFICLSYCEEINYNKSSNEHMEKKGNVSRQKSLKNTNHELNYSFNIPNNIYNSFVTIHKYNKKNTSSEDTIKVDDLIFLGSGFIYNKNGYILTAAHNIANKEDIFVIKNGDNFFIATIIGLHKESDVCVLKINSKENLSYITLDSIRDDLKQGEVVIAYGQIQKFDKETCSVGIVNHPKQTFSKFENFNGKKQVCMSGSPLVDQHGNLVGMIQKKIDNYGLALPSNVLKNIALFLQNKGTYKEPSLGIIFKEKEFTLKNGSTFKKELKVHNILPKSSAEIAGLKKGDIILSMNKKIINNICQIHEILNNNNNDNNKEDLEYKLYKNISFNKIKTNLKNLLVVNKNINISDIKYFSCIGKFHDYEKIENFGVNEICILGRSNVGKSTFLRNFIRYLLKINENKDIKVSKNSGCTRSINLYSFENEKRKRLFIITDMPGLGYAEGIGKKKMDYLRKNLDDYIFLRNQICLFFILIDMSVDVQRIDLSLVDMIKRTNVPFRVICTKSDKYDSNLEGRLNAIKNFYNLDKIPIPISKFSKTN
ncbi:ribosome biogenesis GTP-binding protein YsxC [Plasmodium falciparum 7G8]|uniref:Ribosome biogenesis GTP-binding protein YsxC n=1 Tax=Plasmodium falciparum (isolate 7G8) TaxID=57266 RepID=W7FGM6_PLAF8|nr:ribosome biogenesis GTP-binding protein YsxC [Plasmodium falciparum 7G8]